MGSCFQGNRSTPRSTIQMQNYRIIKEAKLAEGAYGDVWKCKQASADTLYALKQIKLQNQQLEAMYTKEVKILTKIRENKLTRVTELKQAMIDTRKEGRVGCLLFEFGTISLFDEISSHKLTQRQIITILLEVVTAIEQIHKIKIYHLDIKPQNLILVDGHYKLCDFGSAIDGEIVIDQLTKRQKNSFQDYVESNSTLIYRSPEMVDLDHKIIGGASDVWMLGCIAYLMVYRKHPFEGEGKLAIISANTKYPFENAITPLIKQMLNIEQKSRPAISQLHQKLTSLLAQLS